jgi:hypothetical protein
MEQLNLFIEQPNKKEHQHKQRQVTDNEIEDLFDFWKTVFNKRTTTQLDETRRKKLATAIRAYGTDTCKKAILGCSKSPFHTGRNPGNKKYTDITLIFRNAEKTEQFVEIWETETAAQTDMDNWLNN